MFYEVAKGHPLKHEPLKALVAPRPIGWISAMSREGAVNLSPYSFFNMVSDRPPIVMFSSSGKKDAVSFIEETGEFVCNIVTFELMEAMNLTSATLPRGESEFVFAGLEPAPCEIVKPPRVRDAVAALECKLIEIRPLKGLGGAETDQHLVFGQAVGVHLAERIVKNGIVDTASFHLVGRGGGFDYAVADRIVQLRRPG